jgi:murein L,D-transpeptidase YcbB/YkuD
MPASVWPIRKRLRLGIFQPRSQPKVITMRPAVLVTGFLLAFTAACSGQARAQDQDVREVVRERIDRLQETGALSVEGADITAGSFVVRFYQSRRFRLAWNDPANSAALLRGIEASFDHGLDPEDFHISTIRRLYPPKGPDPVALAEFDILLTDATAQLLRQLWFGKVDPLALDADWNLERPFLAGNPVEIVTAVLANNHLDRLIDDVQIKHPYYLTLKAALRSYRETASAGGWSAIPQGETLKPGMSDARVRLLRQRLARSGDYNGVGGPDSDLYDEGLVEALKAFQARHALDSDGAIGPATLSALNVPVQARIDQIRVNLERARWVLRELGRDFILVNIAGFYVDLVRDDQLVWRTRGIVGKTYHKTPIFRDQMSYIVLNPTWTVTRNVIRNEIIPKQQKDPAYLERNNFDLIDRSGHKVGPSSISWADVDGRNFPYNVVQHAGPDNALGQAKFIFPNEHAVYLHDTPRRDLFSRSERAFSHGCIRVKDPLELAELLLADRPEWSRARINEVIASGETTTVHLSEKLPVLLLYWTVDPDPAGDVRFYTDIYDRDDAVLAALARS